MLKTIAASYQRLIDHFVPDAIRENREASNPARMFLISHTLGPLLGNTVPLALYFVDATPGFDILVLALSITGFWIFPFLLRRGWDYNTLVVTSVLNLNFCIYWSCYFNGGVLSPTLPWVLLIPILSFFYIGGNPRLQGRLMSIFAGAFGLFLIFFYTTNPPPNDITFRAELFIVSSIIAWTYLLHAWFRREGIDYRYKDADGTVRKTKQGEDCYWELGKCLRHERCPIPAGAIKNLDFLLEIRHEVEHRSTSRIDDAISAKLQACCINFNDAIKSLFGTQYGLERRLPIALQFVTFSSDQRAVLKKASSLPAHIEAMMNDFHHGLTEEEQADPRFAYRVAFVPKVGNRASNADLAIEFIKADSEEAKEVSRVLLKEVNKRRYTPKQVVEMMQVEGYPAFTQHHHTQLWKSLDAKDPAKGFGCAGDYRGTWVWFDVWIARVRAHCQEQGEKYK